MDERELGLLSRYDYGKFLRDESMKANPSQESREVKIERQAGQPEKQTITSSYQPRENTLGPVGEFLSGAEAKLRSFDPLEWWGSISSAVDAEFDKGASQPVGPSGAPAPSSGFSQDVGLNGPMYNGMTPDSTGPIPPVGNAPSSGFMQDTGLNGPMYNTPQPDPLAGNSYADMAATNPTQGVMQPGSAGASWLPSQIEPTAIEPVNRYPELTDYPQYGNNMDTGAGVNDAFNGVIRPDQMTGPTAAMAVTPSGVGEFDGVYQSGDQMVTDQMNPQQVEQKAGELNSVGMVDDPEWVDIQDQAGVPKASQQQTQAALDEVKVSVPTSNEMSGRDLTSDPIMRNFDPDPAQRHADYIKQMNMIMMGGMLLDLAASALGVRSNSGRYMDTQMKILESQMKFDDQQRIDDAVNSVYYPDGEYANPGSQADVFEALMKTGLVKPAEASAISGYHPDQASYKEIYRVGPDGKVETKQVRKDEVTPEGWTDSSGVATFNARLDDEDDPTKSTSAQKNLIQIQEFQTQIAAADELGDVAEANRLRGLLADFKRLSGASGTKQENTISEARQTFTSIYPTSVREMGSMLRADGTPYPWDEYFNDWSRMWSVRVIDPTTGQSTEKPGFLQLMQREPAQSSAQSVPLADAIAILRQDPETNLPFFVKRYGVEAVPEDLRGLINE